MIDAVRFSILVDMPSGPLAFVSSRAASISQTSDLEQGFSSGAGLVDETCLKQEQKNEFRRLALSTSELATVPSSVEEYRNGLFTFVQGLDSLPKLLWILRVQSLKVSPFGQSQPYFAYFVPISISVAPNLSALSLFSFD